MEEKNRRSRGLIVVLEIYFNIVYNSFMLQTVNFAPGDVVRVHQRIQEGDKSRVQVFEGTVLSLKGRGEGRSFQVQKRVGSIAVERIWPVNSPMIEKIEVIEKSRRRVRRAKLNHLHLAK